MRIALSNYFQNNEGNHIFFYFLLPSRHTFRIFQNSFKNGRKHLDSFDSCDNFFLYFIPALALDKLLDENVRASNSLFQGYPAFKRVKMFPTILKAISKFCTTKKTIQHSVYYLITRPKVTVKLLVILIYLFLLEL